MHAEAVDRSLGIGVVPLPPSPVAHPATDMIATQIVTAAWTPRRLIITTIPTLLG